MAKSEYEILEEWIVIDSMENQILSLGLRALIGHSRRGGCCFPSQGLLLVPPTSAWAARSDGTAAATAGVAVARIGL